MGTEQSPQTAPTLTQEFVIALRQEIEAARRNEARTRVAMREGRRLGKIGRDFQYRFWTDTAQTLAGDMPAEIILVSGQRVRASVIECQGLQIRLSVETDLGHSVPSAYLSSDLTQLLERLIDRIQELDERGNPAGDRLMSATFSGQPLEDEVSEKLTASQVSAIRSGLGRDCTFIWGPTGTGKTQTIAALADALVARDRRTLIISHTNTAVDGALLRVAANGKIELEQGLVIRIGQPRKEEMRRKPELLLETHVACRLAEIHLRLQLVLEQRAPLETEAKELSNRVDVLEWLELALPETNAIDQEIVEIQNLRKKRDASLRALEESRRDVECLEELLGTHAEIIDRAGSLQQRKAKLDSDRTLLPKQETEHHESVTMLGEVEHKLACAKLRDKLQVSIDRRLRAGFTSDEHQTTASRLEECEVTLKRLSKELEDWREQLRTSEACGRLARMWRKLPEPETARRWVKDYTQQAERMTSEVALLSVRLSELTVGIAEREEAERQISSFQNLAKTPELERSRDRVALTIRSQVEAIRSTKSRISENERWIAETEKNVQQFTTEHGYVPSSLPFMLEEQKVRANAAGKLKQNLVTSVRTRERDLLERVLERQAMLTEWGMLEASEGQLDQRAKAVVEAIRRQARLCAGISIADRRLALESVNAHIAVIDDEIEELKVKLSTAEVDVIADAKVVGATLTNSYLRESILRSPFDTVILDEASMAAIPAVWAAAALAQKAVVIVGDFLQLPPIVQSEEREARKWLGRDIFEVAEVYAPTKKENLVVLEEQFRMDPQISRVPAGLIYRGEIRDGWIDPDKREKLATALGTWFDTEMEPSSPLVLVDTGSLGAWVTACGRGGNPSRLNLFSAALSRRILARYLRPGRPNHATEGEPRCLVVAPYRPQARVVDKMLRDAGLDRECLAGTAHSFQGGEADVVVLDLVNDTPHWKVAMLMADPARNREAMRLLNVAITRARRRLFIVGDFEYLARSGRRSFLGGVLVPFLRKHYPVVEALTLLKEPLAAHSYESFAGAVAENAFWKATKASSNSVLLYSRTLCEVGVNKVQSALSDPPLAGVQKIVVTTRPDDLGKRAGAKQSELIQRLKEGGIAVVRKRPMNESMAIIDGTVWLLGGDALGAEGLTWAERLTGGHSVPEILETFAVDKILRACLSGAYECPICERPMEMRETNDAPFYWSCPTPGCYTRDIDGPELSDGRLVCKHDGKSVIFDRTKSGKPIWRCTESPRHFIYVSESHLRLPRMRDLIPKRELERLETELPQGRLFD